MRSLTRATPLGFMLLGSGLACWPRYEPLPVQPPCDTPPLPDTRSVPPLRLDTSAARSGQLSIRVMAAPGGRGEYPLRAALVELRSPVAADSARPGRELRPDSAAYVRLPVGRPAQFLLRTRAIGFRERLDTIRVSPAGAALVVPLLIAVEGNDDRCHHVVMRRKPWWKWW